MNGRFLESSDEFLVRVGVRAVAGLQVSKTADVVLFGESVGRFLGDDHIVTEHVGVGGGVAAAHVRVETGDDHGLDTQFLEEDYVSGLAYLKTCYGADAYTNEELIAAF